MTVLINIPQGPSKISGAYVNDTPFMMIVDVVEKCDVLLNNMLDKQNLVCHTQLPSQSVQISMPMPPEVKR